MAVSDIFLVKSIGQGILKGAWKMGSHKWPATRQWLLKHGYAKKGQPVHHWAVHQEVGKKYDIEWLVNQPWNCKAFPDAASHMRYGHGTSWKGLPPGAWWEQALYGTPLWFKLSIFSSSDQLIDGGELIYEQIIDEDNENSTGILIFIFVPKDNMPYIFWEEKLYKTTNTLLIKKWKKNSIIIDSSGLKYIEKGIFMTGWRGIYGYFTSMKGRVIAVDYEYDENIEKVSLRNLQEIILERFPKSRWFHSHCWKNIEDFKETLFSCTSFEEIAQLFVRKPSNNFLTRIFKGY